MKEEINVQLVHIQQELERYVNLEKRAFFPKFFKTGKGQYGEGDQFLGIVVPDIRRVAKNHKEVPFEVITGLLGSKWHECRLCALLMLVERYKKADEKARSEIYRFYLSRTKHINNWDLVDLSSSQIVGQYLLDKQRDDLYRLAVSSNLWEQRIAVVSTYTFIRNNDFTDILTLAGLLLNHPHDLMHKAIGWMLREVGKKDKPALVDFLEKHHKEMPRTMLRYSIEKFTSEEREHFMQR